MAFEGLTEKLNAVFSRLRGKGHLTESDVREAMREIRLALLEADVSYPVVKDFVRTVTERAIGADVMESLTPGQMVVKIVHEELISLMGGEASGLNFSKDGPTVVMMVGLQGSGKTTNGAKLAGMLKKRGRRPLLVACDVYRPAAIDQLEVVGRQVGVPVFQMGQIDPVEIATAAVEHARQHANDVVFLDTAGRLHIDEALMDELRRIKAAVQPNEILLVIDAMIGQDAVNAASAFDQALDLTGVMLTKLDGDARGGAALSVKATTGKPSKFVGVGEKLDAVEVFYPDRMASRILGMGDVLSLIEKAQTTLDEKKAAELEEKIRKNRFTLQDYYDQLLQVRKMGSVRDILGMMPGVNAAQLENANIDERSLDRLQAIILSMTPQERDDPSILNASRRRRIAAGAGVQVSDVNRLIQQYDMMQKLTRQMSGGKVPKGIRKLLGRMKGMPGMDSPEMMEALGQMSSPAPRRQHSHNHSKKRKRKKR